MPPLSKRAQRHQNGASQYRGGDGPLHVSEGSIENELYQAFIDAGVQAGYPRSDDLNGYQQEGFGRLEMTVNPQKVLFFWADVKSRHKSSFYTTSSCYFQVGNQLFV